MSPTDDNLPTLDDQRFDLLVDGELPESDRRNLLLTLDDLPGGWRRCALAFLEAQSWKEAMRFVGEESALESQAAGTVGRRGFPGGTWGTLLAVAASFLIALGLGLVWHEVWRPGAGARPSPIQVAVEPQRPSRPDPQTDEPEPPTSPAVPGDAWQVVTVPVGIGAGGPGSIQLPARELDQIDERWPEQFAPTIPAELLQALEAGGHEVRRSRRLLPFRMDDGRQLVVPFEQVELRFVGGSAYQ